MAQAPEFDPAKRSERLAALCRPVDPKLVTGAIEQAGFAEAAYLAANPALENACSGPGEAALHFALDGFADRRRFPIELAPDPIAALLALPVVNRAYVVNLAAALTNAWMTDGEPETCIEAKWPVLVRLRELGAMPFILAGSSDARNYLQSSVRGARWLVPLPLLGLSAAAMGLGRLSEPSAFAERVRRFIQTINGLPGGMSVPCLFKFGQVDAEFAYNLARVRDRKPQYDRNGFRDFCARSVGRYTTFLEAITAIVDRERITIASIFPSSVSDDSWAGGFLRRHARPLRKQMQLSNAELLERLRELEIPDQWERVSMNRYYNSLLRSTATALGLRYQDDFEILLNAQGVLDAAFMRRGQGEDCHLDVAPTSRELTLLLWELVDSLPQQAAVPASA